VSLRADAVVIGTGAGGGPAAAVLAEKGLDVVVLEAGPRVEAGDFNGNEAEMTARLWALGATDGGMTLYAGACVGGSTVINDALCFRPPAEILADWRDRHGLGGLTETAMAPFVDAAWAGIHAEATGSDHMNRNARLLELGAKRLGWAAGAAPRSVRDCVNLGLCNFGCPSNAKQSTLVTYVPRAEEAKARVMASTRALRLRIAGGEVTAVEARGADGQPVVIETPRVCVGAGVLGTAPLLQRSGLAAGDGVAVHSSTHVSARFPMPVHAYYGPTMAFVVHEFSDVNGNTGPGVMIESVAASPLATATALPGFGPAHADALAQLPHLARSLIVVRDRSRGRIDADGRVAYALLPEDVERLRVGMREAARAYLIAGADEVWLPVNGLPPIRSESDLVTIDAAAQRPGDFALLYAVHLFGGAAMGSVCDESGAVRGVRGLWVVDAAALPTNTGVNPQITIMANALRIAQGIA
jgi:choline dehydrogenase-like flavoprotein